MKKRANYNDGLKSNSIKEPLLVVLSGPSGVGKDAVLNRLRQSGFPIRYITTLTTRPIRPGEKDGVDYQFVTADEFKNMIADNRLLEWANVYGNLYGVPREDVKQALDSGEDALVKVDVQGAATIRKTLPEAVFIFLMPPSMEALKQRLTRRYTESPQDITRRFNTAEKEMEQLPMFDYKVVNEWGQIDQAVSEVKNIITAEKKRVPPRKIKLD